MESTRTSPSLAVFGCLELCHIIALSLKQTDLYSCLLVNKILSKNMLPYLWRHITFSDYTPYYTEFYVLNALGSGQRLLEQGREQEGGDSDVVDKSKEMDELPTGTTTLDPQQPEELPTPKRQKRKERPQDRLLGRVTNPWLVPKEPQDASEPYFPFSPPYSQLVKYGHLVEWLTLEWNEEIGFLMDAEMKALPKSKQEEPEGMIQSWVYIRLMEQCRNTRVLEIVTGNTDLPFRLPRGWCGNAIIDIHWRREERLIAKDRALAKVIEAAGRLGVSPGLSSSSGYNVETLSDDERVPIRLGIQEFYLSGSSGFRRESFKAFIRAFSSPGMSSKMTHPLAHHPRLRVLDISGCEYIQSEQMHILLTCLPGLQVVDFRCRQHLLHLFSDSGLEYHSGYSQLLDENDHVRTMTKGLQEKGFLPCQNSLRVLKVGVKTVYMHDTVVESSWAASSQQPGSGTEDETILPPKFISGPGGPFDVLTKLPYPACFGWFYDYVSRLVNLRELCLITVKEPMEYGGVTTGVRLTLKEGLGRWHGLKELEVLDVEYLQHGIGIEEVQWMVAHWPQLKMIRGLAIEDTLGKYVDLEMVTGEEAKERAVWAEAVRWLKETRPDIELPVLLKRWKGVSIFDLTEDEDL